MAKSYTQEAKDFIDRPNVIRVHECGYSRIAGDGSDIIVLVLQTCFVILTNWTTTQPHTDRNRLVLFLLVWSRYEIA